jgi:hypothetical protein
MRSSIFSTDTYFFNNGTPPEGFSALDELLRFLSTVGVFFTAAAGDFTPFGPT